MTGLLANQLRPRTLRQFLGFDAARIAEQFRTGRAPFGWILAGEAGTGKTSLARVLAQCYQTEDPNELPGDTAQDIYEINASDLTGIDGVRELIKLSSYVPSGIKSKARVFILDEAHSLSRQAQQSLLKPAEEGPGVWIFVTTEPSKLVKTVRDRCYSVTMLPLALNGVRALVKRAAKVAGFSGKPEPLLAALKHYEVNRPRAVINACERFFNGASAKDAAIGVYGGEAGCVDVIGVCRLVSNGNADGVLKAIKGAEVGELRGVRLAALSYLRKVMLSSGGLGLGAAIKTLAVPLPPEDPAVAALITATLYEAAVFISDLETG